MPPPDLSWAAADVARFALPQDYVLLVPGGAPHRPEKRWPVERFVALARRIAAAGADAGGDRRRRRARARRGDRRAVPEARDLTGQTSSATSSRSARGARRAVGNDTGPMHLAVVGGAPATVLYSAASDPALTAPRGPTW